MDAVVDDLQLGGLVHDVLGAGDLAAIVQPGGQVERVALVLGEREVGVGAAGIGAHAVGHHDRQRGHPLAVAAGIGALGVDRIGEHPDHRVEQLLLRLDQLPRLDRRAQHAGQAKRKGLEPRRGVVLVLGVAQHQQALHPTGAAAQLELDALQAVRGACRGRRIAAAGARQRFLQAVRIAGNGRPGHGLRVLLQQVDGAAAATRGMDELLQHLRQHGFDAGLGAEHVADRQEGLDRVADVVHDAIEFPGLTQPCRRIRRPAEIEGGHALGLRGGALQRPPDAAAAPPPQAQEQQDQAAGDQDHALAVVLQVAQQFVGGRRQQQADVHIVEAVERQHDPQPLMSCDVIRDGSAVAGDPAQIRQGLDPQVVQRPQVRISRGQGPGREDPRVAVGDHRAAAVDQRKLGARRDAQFVQHPAQVVQHDVQAHDGLAALGPPRQADAHLAGREKHIGRGDGQGRALAGVRIPGPLARVVPVIGLAAARNRAQPAVVEQEISLGRAVGRAGDRLHQEAGLPGRAEMLADARVVEHAGQQEIPVVITDVQRGNQGIGSQLFGQQPHALQAVLQARRAHDGIERQGAQGGRGRLDHPARVLEGDLRRIVGGARGRVEQQVARVHPAQRDQDGRDQENRGDGQARDEQAHRPAPQASSTISHLAHPRWSHAAGLRAAARRLDRGSGPPRVAPAQPSGPSGKPEGLASICH
ncbi:Uncharacterised protein [Bordetella pertussis]|nr:Uncharacterised protein [Bordetella pertussis]CFL93519.1 Uncharacterised protein [Bordetella pertussis]CFM16233.1 Uncharacterised protein [Bordetella pertussis]CFM22556.1 Uncharacterised protein [Bordetella pertussis]CFM82324.1 Uncharacterised protein [Bordetella pertussis]